MKRCKRCGEHKPIDGFSKSKTCSGGRRSICKDCMRPKETDRMREYRGKNPNYYNDMRKRSLLTWKINEIVQSAKRRAKSKGIAFDLDKEWVRERIVKVCPLSGLEYRISLGVMCPFSPSLDKIDRNLGYTKNNCRLILHGLNCLKGTGSDDDMFRIIEAMRVGDD